MTLDEAIKHAEEVAEKFESLHERYENMDEDRLLFRVEENECKNCVKEHRQLAEWLKELKKLREQTKTGHWNVIDQDSEGDECFVHTWETLCCSRCGMERTTEDGYIPQYCESCGAKMDE